jgi:hypothetical protein
MPLQDERAFSANSPVGRYWLRNCVGFRVEGFRGRVGIVDEIGLGPDGADVLAVRRGIVLRRISIVPTQRVESVHPWDDTIVLGARRRHPSRHRVARAQRVTDRLRPVARAAAVETARALRDGTIVVLRLLAALGSLLFGLAVVVRDHAPAARRHVSSTGTALKLIGRAYASEARRAWHAERNAIAAWRDSRRERAEEPGDDGPLTRAGADDVDARRRDRSPRR